MTIPDLMAAMQYDGVELRAGRSIVHVQGRTEESRRWLPVIEDNVDQLLAHLRAHRRKTAADLVRAAEAIIQAPRSRRRARCKQTAR